MSSDEEREPIDGGGNSDENVEPQKTKKFRLVLESDSENEEPAREVVENSTKKPILESDESDDGLLKLNRSNERKLTTKKISPFLDSDVSDKESEDLNDNNVEENTVGPKMKSKLDSDIYDAESSSDEDSVLAPTQSDGESPIINQGKSINKLYLNSDIYDAEGSSDEERIPHKLHDENRNEDGLKTGKKPKERKKSTKKNMKKELEDIHAEAQRLVRVSNVYLPYHTPKQRTLDDFLNRRKSNPPVVPLRTSAQHIKQVWEHIEKREIEAETFYKSESEESQHDEESKTEIKEKTQARFTINPVKDNEAEVNDNKQVEPKEENKEKLDTDQIEKIDTDENVPTDSNAESSVIENSENVGTPGDNREVENSVVDKPKEKAGAPLENSIMDVILDIVPKISSTPDGVIDLEESSSKPGPIGLIQRFFKHSALKQKPKKENITISVTCADHGADGEIVKLTEELVTVQGEQRKPGERLATLRASLQESMAANRQQQLNNRIKQYNLNEQELYNDDTNDDPLAAVDEFDFVDKHFEKELCDTGDSDEELEDDEKSSRKVNKKKKEQRSNQFVDDEAEVSEDEELGSGDEDLNSEEDEDDEQKNRSDDEDNDKGSEAIQLSQEGSFNDSFFKSPKGGTQNSSVLAEDDTDCTPSDSQLMSLCSGKFGSQPIKLADLEKDDDVLNEESSDFKLVFSEDTTQENTSKFNSLCKSFLESSDDEEEPKLNEKKTKKKRLCFSDDEDETNDDKVGDNGGEKENEDEDESEFELENANEQIESQEDAEEQEEGDTKEVYYDEEERELANVKGFFDNEAELSESEWGSEDEDERNLDILETEEADNEKINQRKLKSELDRIHMKQVLADDSKAIRILKEMYLEDGELDTGGQKRQRLFRWSNVDGDENDKMTGFGGIDDGPYLGEDDEDEEVWRKARLERESFLLKNKPKHIDEDEADLLNVSASIVKLNKTITPKPAAVKSSNKDLLASPEPKHPFKLLSKRGSFLGRSERMLSKLAELTNSCQGDAPLIKSKGKRNMVFATISPPKNKSTNELPPNNENILKRKSTATVESASKKLKFSEMCDTSKCISFLEKLRTNSF